MPASPWLPMVIPPDLKGMRKYNFLGRMNEEIRRFDRRAGARVPYFSARTALNRSGAEQGSYTEIAEAIRMISKAARADLHELWARMAFNVLVTNTDDHLKNHGFIYADNGLWRLSPFFDVNPQAGRHRYLETAIIEGGPFKASLDLAVAAAEFFDLSEHEAHADARDGLTHRQPVQASHAAIRS